MVIIIILFCILLMGFLGEAGGVIVGILFFLGILYFCAVKPIAEEKRRRVDQNLAKQYKAQYERGEISGERYIALMQAMNAISQEEMRQVQQKKDTRQIIKGAVVGGIIGGDAGAVVGAAVEKNKIDNRANDYTWRWN